MPEGFWVKGYWGERSLEPIKTVLVKRGAEPIKNIKIERSAKPIKTTDASTQAPPLALLLARVHSVHFAPGTYSTACTYFQQVQQPPAGTVTYPNPNPTANPNPNPNPKRTTASPHGATRGPPPCARRSSSGGSQVLLLAPGPRR